MATKTRKTTNVRESKVAKSGSTRKNELRRKGTTAPNLLLNKPNANEAAQIAARAKK